MLLASSRGCGHCNFPWESLLEFLAVPYKTRQDLALYLSEEGWGARVRVCLLIQGAVWWLCRSDVSVEPLKSPAGLSLRSPEAGAWLEELCSVFLMLLAHSTSDHWTLKRFLACPKGMFCLDRAHTFKSNSQTLLNSFTWISLLMCFLPMSWYQILFFTCVCRALPFVSFPSCSYPHFSLKIETPLPPPPC